MSRMMKCDICKSEETYLKNYKHSYMIKNHEITFTSKRRFCAKCHNLVYDPFLDNQAANLGIKIYNEKYGIPKEKIVELRKNYNLSQELFSKIIGCAKKTLISYEKGTSIPNDNYLIIIKSLIASPETISIIIEANKEQFTPKEYEKLSKSVPYIANNTKQLLYRENIKLSEYNGYQKLNKNKVFNMMIFFANNGVVKTKMLKEMFYADFLYYKENCVSITGLEYSKLFYGPVPDQYEQIINEALANKMIELKYEIKKDYESCCFYDKKAFDKTIFSKEELMMMKRIKTFFLDFKAKDIVDFSHKEKAFKESEFFHKISYDYAFYIPFI